MSDQSGDRVASIGDVALAGAGLAGPDAPDRGSIDSVGHGGAWFYGEGTDAYGNVFQVSNQQTLGFNEKEIIDNVLGLVRQLVEQERAARQLLADDSGDELADRVWRAYGILRYARSLSGQEALGLLSAVRLGIDLGIITHLQPEVFTEMIIGSRSCVVARMAQTEKMDKAERNRLRAKIVRERIKGGENDV